MHQKIRTFLEAVWRPETRLVVAVSGGPDSLAMLHLLWRCLGADRLVAAHLNHGWRDTAVPEAEIVRQTAVSWGIPCRVGAADVPALARQEGWSLEEAGRMARYRFFADVSRDVGATASAVGHNANDQVETILMRLLRGAGLRGLAGMQAVAPMPDAPDLQVIRPLLTITRSEIETYCQENGLEPVRDPSNLDTTFFRNRVRHDLLPLLAQYNPQIRERLRQMAVSVAADEAFLQEQTAAAWSSLLAEQGGDWLTLNRRRWQALSASLQLRLLRRAVAVLRPSAEISFTPIRHAFDLAQRNQSGLKADLPGGVTLLIESDALYFTLAEAILPVHLPQMTDAQPISLPVPGEVRLPNGWRLTAQQAASPSLTAVGQNRDPWLAYLAVSDLSALQIRPRRPGERIQPLGLHGRSTKLKEVMIDRKIPARLRPLWPLVATGGRPLWLVGHILDERARVTETAKLVVQIRCFHE